MENNINRYLTMLLVQQETEILGVALNLKLFKLLENNQYTALEIAKMLTCDYNNMKILLDGLVLMDILDENNEVYTNTDITQKFFIHDSSTYCGDTFLHRQAGMSHARSVIGTLVKDGKEQIEANSDHKQWSDAARTFLKQEQKNIISLVTNNIVENLKEFKGMKKMLDLGCSSGVIGLEILKKHASLEGVFFDYPAVTDVVETHIKEYNLQERAITLSGDIEIDDIGSGYDLVWCSSIFYFAKNREKLIQKIYDALNPNGILISSHVEVDKKNVQEKNSFFYFLFMGMQGRGVLKPMELSGIFDEVGFRSISSYTTNEMPMTSAQIHIAKK